MLQAVACDVFTAGLIGLVIILKSLVSFILRKNFPKDFSRQLKMAFYCQTRVESISCAFYMLGSIR